MILPSINLPPPQERIIPKQILPSVYIWSVFSEEKGFYFNGYAIKTDEGPLIIDPPTAGTDVLEALTTIGRPLMVLITNGDHERESNTFREKFKIPVLAPQQDQQQMNFLPDKTFDAGDILPGGLKVIPLSHQKTPGESAFYHPEQRMLILGDALIGHPVGALSMLPEAKYPNREQAFQSLKKLADIDLGLETLLLGDGEPFLENAQHQLEMFFVRNLPE